MAGVFIVFAGIMGAVVGSFLSAVALRLPRGEDIVWRRSHCPQCLHALGPRELVPLVSFLVQRGRCRHCGARLSRRYPFLEGMSAALFVLTLMVCGATTSLSCETFPLPVWWFFLSVLLLVAVIDYTHLLVPEGVVGGTFLIALLGRGIFAPATIMSALAAAALGGGLFWAIVKLSRERWMGMGDAYVGALLGIVLGWPVIVVALISASLLGGLWGVGLLLLKQKALGDEVPFVPFLAAGGVVAFLGTPLTGPVLDKLLYGARFFVF